MRWNKQIIKIKIRINLARHPKQNDEMMSLRLSVWKDFHFILKETFIRNWKWPDLRYWEITLPCWSNLIWQVILDFCKFETFSWKIICFVSQIWFFNFEDYFLSLFCFTDLKCIPTWSCKERFWSDSRKIWGKCNIWDLLC